MVEVVGDEIIVHKISSGEGPGGGTMIEGCEAQVRRMCLTWCYVHQQLRGRNLVTCPPDRVPARGRYTCPPDRILHFTHKNKIDRVLA